jgi:hypothetical protein
MSTEKKSLRERVAALKASKQKAAKENKTRVASAWTIAKTMLPQAPSDVQFKLASSLLGNSTLVLTAMLRQTAINAHYTKLAEKFEQIHKVELNEACEDPSFLEKMKKEVEKELKGEAKSASAECVCEGKGCENCKKTAGPETEDAPLVEEKHEEEIHDEGLPPVEEEVHDEEMPPLDEEVPPTEGAGEPIPDEKKEELKEKIDALEADVEALELAVENEEELDFSKIFDEEGMEEKTSDLANENDHNPEDVVDSEDFFGPSDAKSMESALNSEGMDFAGHDDLAGYFHTAGDESAGMDSLLADSKVAGDKVLLPGEMGEDLLDEAGVTDAEKDHEDSILYEVLSGVKGDKFEPTGFERETEPKLEMPKAASTKKIPAGKKPLRSLGDVKIASDDRSKDQRMLSALVFPDDQGSW